MPCTCQQPDGTPAAVGLLGAATEPFDHAFPVPAYPPASWYAERPDWLTPDTKISVDDQGRVAGYFYNAGQCLVHNAAACPKPSPTFYAAFHQQDVATDDGSLVRCGVIGNVNGHANEYAPVDVAQAHYADPDRQLISCRAYDDEHGGYILGSVVPHATYGDVALLRRSALSGDWRPMGPEWWRAHGVQASVVRDCENYDCIGPTLVTRPGLPLVQRFAAAILGGVGGIQLDEQEHNMAGETTIDLGDGIKIVRTAPAAAAVAAAHPTTPPGPQPAVTAASPPPPPPNAGGGASDAEPPAEATSESDLDARVAQLEQDVADIKDALGQIIDQMMAPAQAAAVLPSIEDEPAPTT